MTTIEAPREQTRARYPGPGRLRRARRRPHLLRGLRHGRADRAAAADLVDHPLAPLEGADPLSRAPRARGDLRRARQRPHGPPGASRGLRRARVRRRRPGGHGRHGTDRAVLVGAVGRRPLGRRCSPPSTPSAWTAPCSSRRRAVRAAPGARDARRSTSRWSPTRAGRSTTATTGSRTTATSSSSSSRRSSPSRTRPSSIEDCVGWGLETHGRDAGADLSGPRAERPRRVRGAVPPRSRCPVLVIHGTDDAVRPVSVGEQLAEETGGDARRRSRAPGTARTRATRCASTCCCATSSRRGRRRGLWTRGRRRAQARALRLVADRARPRAARHRDRPRAAPACTPTSRSTGWPSIR